MNVISWRTDESSYYKNVSRRRTFLAVRLPTLSLAPHLVGKFWCVGKFFVSVFSSIMTLMLNSIINCVLTYHELCSDQSWVVLRPIMSWAPSNQARAGSGATLSTAGYLSSSAGALSSISSPISSSISFCETVTKSLEISSSSSSTLSYSSTFCESSGVALVSRVSGISSSIGSEGSSFFIS